MIIFIILLILDQFIKIIIVNNNFNFKVIDNLLSITYVKNSGIVFGFFQGSNGVMIFISTLICIFLFAYALKHYNNDKLKLYTVYIILAGGIGNLLDRIFRGFVVDYIETPFIATFNLADACVVMGIFLLIILETCNVRKDEKNR